jgi:hypothetical protein
MSQALDLKEMLKLTKLNPVQKMGLNGRFKHREFPGVTEQDNIYKVTLGQHVIHIRAAKGGLTPDEMDMVADVLQRGRRNEQKAMMDMLSIIQVLPLGQETVEVLLEEWKQNGIEAELVKGPGMAADRAEEQQEEALPEA